MLKITIDGKEYEYEYGTPYSEIAKDFEPYKGLDVLLVKSNSKLFELHKTVKRDCNLEMVTLRSSSGHYSYERTAIFVLLKAIHDARPHLEMDKVQVMFSISNGLYITIKDHEIDEKFIDDVKQCMNDIVAAKLPIIKKNVTTDVAVETFDMLEMKDKVELFKYRRSSRTNLYYIDNYTDYFYGYMLLNTGYIKLYDLIQYNGGMVLILPTVNHPDKLEPFNPSCKLFDELIKHEEFMRSVSTSNVAEINHSITNGGFSNTILIQEAYMEKRIADIADRIVKENKNIVLIAGPSSSGKTTSSHRISVQLQSHGLKTKIIEADDYFKNREETPLDEDGKPDYESLGAMDIEGFTEDITNISNGEIVELPSFNFITGHREYKGDKIQLSDGDVLIIEGIHCLDDAMVGGLPDEKTFKVFIGPLAHLNIDDHNLFDPIDGRLIRRIVRDNRNRGISAKQTIELWPSVRKGEDIYINPFMDKADEIFISSLVYEICVLKPYAEALLFGVDRNDPSFVEANRILKLLDYFLTIPYDLVPSNSLLSEFIGGNVFNV